MKSTVDIEISGPAYRVTAHIVNNKILKEINAIDDEDAEYENNKYSVAGNLSLRTIRVAEGFCIYRAEDFNCDIKINGVKQEIQKIGFLEECEIFEDAFDVPRENALIARYENGENLGDDLKLKRGEMLIIEVEDIKYAKANIFFTVADPVTMHDIELGIVNLDVDSDLSDATYMMGLLDGMEKDIKYIICKGEKYEIDIEVLNGHASRFSLIKKTKEKNKWKEVFLD